MDKDWVDCDTSIGHTREHFGTNSDVIVIRKKPYLVKPQTKYIIEYSALVWRSSDNDYDEGEYFPEVFYTMIVECFNAGVAMRIAKKHLKAVVKCRFPDDWEDMLIEDCVDYTATKLETYVKNLEKNFKTTFKEQQKINEDDFIKKQCGWVDADKKE
jgi:hypothetical protein